jgi:2-amino-4-hydroxy-6-hydroxymethyldihydropteridine diphosphokinase
VRAFLGMGSNEGDRLRFLREAVESLGRVSQVSPVYETDPVGGPPGQLQYLNLVVELETDLSPRALLGVCQRLEAAAGRVRGERWGPRTLDVDILLVDDLVVDEPDLTVPHPRMYERRFVMAPLADIAPDVVPPEWQAQAGGSVRVVGTLEDYERHPARGRNVEG